MKIGSQYISIWMSAFFGAIMVVAFLLFPGFLPTPMSPEWDAARVAEFYNENKTWIRATMITFDICGVMLVPLYMVVVHQLKRMSTDSDVFAYAYLSAAASGVTLFAIANLFWLIAAFRPERDAQFILLLNDIAWVTFIAPVGTTIAMNLCLACAIYMDKRPVPVFPRWVAHFNIGLAAATAPAACAAVFRSGPLAWDGFISFWVRLAAYAANVLVLFVVLRPAIRREAEEDARTADEPDRFAAVSS